MKRGTWTVAVVFVAGMAAATLGFLLFEGRGTTQEGQGTTQQAAKDPLPGTKLSVEQLKAQLDYVRGGRILRPKSWPNGARAAVTFGFDTNATGNLAAGNLALTPLSQQEYGARFGLPRILRVLDKHNIPATFFVPAVTAQLYPQMIPSILGQKQRHEIGVHGWVHESAAVLNNEAEERRLLSQALDYLAKATGRRPVGMISPGTNVSRHTHRIQKDLGFLYDGSLMGGDDPYELLFDGQPSGLIEMPIKWSLNDTMYFGQTGALPNAELASQVWREEFDFAYEEGGLFNLTLHPPSSGHRSPILYVDRLMSYIKSKPGVWIATREQVVRYVKEKAMTTN